MPQTSYPAKHSNRKLLTKDIKIKKKKLKIPETEIVEFIVAFSYSDRLDVNTDWHFVHLFDSDDHCYCCTTSCRSFTGCASATYRRGDQK
jgi:hypothetical protein